MNFLLIGQSVEDHIFKDGTEKVQAGGVYYTAAALLELKDKEDSFRLCTSMRKDKLKLFSPVYDSIDKSYFDFVDDIPVITLTLYPDKERDETYKNLSLGIDLNITDYTAYDGILINMITGFDVSLEHLKYIRNNSPAIIYMDVHSLARKKSLKDNTRRHTLIDNFSEWAECLDIIQVNRNELLTLSQKQTEKEIAGEVLSRDKQYLIVTKENEGAVLYYKSGGHLESITKPGLKVPVNNTVGCGDVFGASFFYFFCKSKNTEQALAYAVKASGLMVSYNSFEQLKNLKKDVLSPVS
jgi:hypothetical protein